MQKQDYPVIADAIQFAYAESFDEHVRRGVAKCAYHISVALRQDNPEQFDDQAFLAVVFDSKQVVHEDPEVSTDPTPQLSEPLAEAEEQAQAERMNETLGDAHLLGNVQTPETDVNYGALGI